MLAHCSLHAAGEIGWPPAALGLRTDNDRSHRIGPNFTQHAPIDTASDGFRAHAFATEPSAATSLMR